MPSYLQRNFDAAVEHLTLAPAQREDLFRAFMLGAYVYSRAPECAPTENVRQEVNLWHEAQKPRQEAIRQARTPDPKSTNF